MGVDFFQWVSLCAIEDFLGALKKKKKLDFFVIMRVVE